MADTCSWAGAAKIIHEVLQAPDWLPPSRRIIGIQGAPGEGKTSCVVDAAKADGVPCWVISGPSMDPTDPKGLGWAGVGPDGDLSAQWLAAGLWREMASYQGAGILCLDDVYQSTALVQSALLAVMDQRRVGDIAMHPGIIIVWTANRRCDRGAGGGRAVISPFVGRALYNLAVEVTPEEWVVWAQAQPLHSAVVDAIDCHPEWLHSPLSDEDMVEGCTGASPRVWHEVALTLRLGKFGGISREDTSHAIRRAFGGALGREFLSFWRAHSQLPNLRTWLANPATCDLPIWEQADGSGLSTAILAARCLGGMAAADPSLASAARILLDRMPAEAAAVGRRRLARMGGA